MITLTGKKISEGIAIGKLSLYKRDIKEIKRIYVKDIEKEILFWCEALNYRLDFRDGDFAMLSPIDGEGINLLLKSTSSPKARRHHMDLFTYHQKEEVERLISLGATLKEWDYEEDADYIVLNDPDGNAFCVIQL